ncbi:hypothetical protein PMAYCL1PPCAC_23639, partial [Pristionchus mayeri]
YIWMLVGRRVVHVISRWTSLGPPPAAPPTPGSFSHRYDTFMSKYPRMLALHRRVVNGSRWCVMDVKQLWALRRVDLHKESEIDKLTIPQLETLIQARVEIPKVTAIIVMLPLPLTLYVIGMAVIFFPRVVLTRHFWTREQREEFFLSDIKRSVESAKSLAFSTLPPTFEELTQAQKSELSKLYGGILPWTSTKLRERYLLTRNIDGRLDVVSLTRDQLLFHLFIRRVVYHEDDDDDSLRRRLHRVIEEARTCSSSPVEYLTASLRSQ